MQHIPPADDKVSKIEPRSTAAGAATSVVSAPAAQLIVPRAEDGKAAVRSAGGATGSTSATASNTPRHSSISKMRQTSGIGFELDQDPRKEGFMHEFLRSGLAHVIYERKTAYWSCSTPAPSKEQQIEDARSMAKQFGIEDFTECLPVYPEEARETIEVLETASARDGKVVDSQKFSVIHAVEPGTGRTHVCVIFKPRLAEEIAKSPTRFDLPAAPSPSDIRNKVAYLSAPENFLSIVSTPMFCRMLYDDEHSIDMFQELHGHPEREGHIHPMTGVIDQKMQSVPEEERYRTVLPVGMIYFKGSDTVEQHAKENIANAEYIGKELDQAWQSAREADPSASFPNVALKETLKRVYR